LISDHDRPRPDRPFLDQAVPDVGIVNCEILDDRRVLDPKNQERLVDGIREDASEEKLAPGVRGAGKAARRAT
jgi:hypothetical protein